MTDAPDPTPAEDDLLAVSALLDGIATADERARVESSPELSALVDELRTLRAELSAPAPVPAAARDAAVERALAVFDELHGPTTADDTASDHEPAPVHAAAGVADRSNVVRFERRRRWYGVLTGAAAAAVAVLFIGALVSGGLGGSDEESASFSTDASAKADTRIAPAETLAGAVPEAAESAEMPAAADPAMGDVFSTGAGGADVESTEAPAATEAAADTTSAASDDTIDRIDGAAEIVSITTPEQLLDYARSQQVVLPLPGLGLPCVDDGAEALGEVTYQGVQTILVRDPASGTITAYDPRDSCAAIVTVGP